MKINNLSFIKLLRNFINTPFHLSRNKCPPPKSILRYLRGIASVKEKIKITRHIKHCSSCAREVEFIQTTLNEENKLFQNLYAVIETAKPRIFYLQHTWKYAAILIPTIILISFIITFLLKTSEISQFRGKENSYIRLEQPINKVNREKIYFRWSKIPTSEYYVLEIFDKTLYPLWKSDKLIKNKASLPKELLNLLTEGESYFWMVTAFFPDKKKIESPLANFIVKK